MQNIADLPKFDLHVHLDGSLRLKTVIELTHRLPADTLPEDLQAALTPPPRCSLEEYLKAFFITIGVLQTKEALTRAAYASGSDTVSNVNPPCWLVVGMIRRFCRSHGQ